MIIMTTTTSKDSTSYCRKTRNENARLSRRRRRRRRQRASFCLALTVVTSTTSTTTAFQSPTSTTTRFHSKSNDCPYPQEISPYHHHHHHQSSTWYHGRPSYQRHRQSLIAPLSLWSPTTHDHGWIGTPRPQQCHPHCQRLAPLWLQQQQQQNDSQTTSSSSHPISANNSTTTALLATSSSTNESTPSTVESLPSIVKKLWETTPKLLGRPPNSTTTTLSSNTTKTNKASSSNTTTTNSSLTTNTNTDTSTNDKANERILSPFQTAISNFLSDPIVEVLNGLLVLVSSLLVAISTVETLPPNLATLVSICQDVIAVIFVTEFMARWIASPNPRKHLANGLVLVDVIVVILPFLVSVLQYANLGSLNAFPIWLKSSGALVNLRLLRILRLQRVLQNMETFTRFERALGIPSINIRPYQLQLARVLLSIFTLLSVATGLIYTAERGVNPNINDYFTALYFGLTTLTTVGFGDITPVTWQGKLVVCASILAGVAVIPAQGAALFEALIERQRENNVKIAVEAAAKTLKEEKKKQKLQQSQEAAMEKSASMLMAPKSNTFPSTDTVNQSANAPTETTDTTNSSKKSESKLSKVSRVLSTASNVVEAAAAASVVAPSNDLVNGGGRMSLETMFPCPTCGACMHWSTAKYCWSCGGPLMESTALTADELFDSADEDEDGELESDNEEAQTNNDANDDTGSSTDLRGERDDATAA